ncbi:MAG: hypothetical protein ACE5J2_01195 [Nitrososphaerales archaeon]
MTIVVSRYWIVTIVVASFAIGITLGQVVILSKAPLNGDLTTINERVDELSSQIEAINYVGTIQGFNSTDITSLKKDIDMMNAKLDKNIKLINTKLDRLKDSANDINNLEDQIQKLQAELSKDSPNTASAKTLTADLDKFEYRAGESLTVHGVGLPDTSVKISLMDADRLVLSEGSTMSDAAGNFIVTIQLPKSLSSGTYKLDMSQEQDLVQREFSIIEGIPAAQGLALSVDRSQYERGDRVSISGRIDPNVVVDLDIFDDRDTQIARTSVISDSSGNFKYSYTINSDDRLGTYTIKATYTDKQATIRFDVVTSVANSPLELRVATDKPEYERGEFVIITGKAAANSKVTILVKPPSGDVFLLVVNSDDDGNYRTIFAVKADANKGTWDVTVKQDTKSAMTTISVI